MQRSLLLSTQKRKPKRLYNKKHDNEVTNLDPICSTAAGAQLRTFHVMAKPTGAACNLNCAYCYFLKKEKLYPDGNFRMSEEVHDAYITQLFDAHRGASQVTVAWQGGEPTLRGLAFFKRSIELQKKLAPPGLKVLNTFQTNGILLDEDWCRFFRDNHFLVGLSLDGPKRFHDRYRKHKDGRGTFSHVMQALRLLQKNKVDFNILCTVNAQNADYPLEVYRFFRDKAHASYVQFIPIVERDNTSGCQEGSNVTARSVRSAQYGEFLKTIFDEWIQRDVGKMFVLNFDGALAGWLGMAGTLCIFAPTCGVGLAMEDNGDLYSCDHFVEPAYLLGNILETPLADMAASVKQQRFGNSKREAVPQSCHSCEYHFVCNGECPKNRFLPSPDGEFGLNYLCASYKSFFAHVNYPMQVMAALIRSGRPAEEVMRFAKKSLEENKFYRYR